VSNEFERFRRENTRRMRRVLVNTSYLAADRWDHEIFWLRGINALGPMYATRKCDDYDRIRTCNSGVPP
jgi:hypothetical protein